MPWIALIVLLFSASADAAWLQYETATRQVIGAFETQADSRPQAGTGLIEIPGVGVPSIAWPIPSGCVKGQPEWTLLSSGSALPLIVNPSLIFFRCKVVTSPQSLRAAVQEETDRLTADVEKVDGRVRMIAILGFAEVRCVGVGTANCNTLRANNGTIGARLGTLPEIIAYQNALIQLYADAQTLRTAQGW